MTEKKVVRCENCNCLYSYSIGLSEYKCAQCKSPIELNLSKEHEYALEIERELQNNFNSSILRYHAVVPEIESTKWRRPTNMVSKEKNKPLKKIVSTVYGTDGTKYIVVLPKKVIAIKHKSDGSYYRTQAICSKEDVFCSVTGINICNLRLNKLRLVDEIAQARDLSDELYFEVARKNMLAIKKIDEQLEKYL